MFELFENYFTWHHAIVSAILLVIFWIVLLIIVQIGAYIWKYIDEKEYVDHNYLIAKIMKMRGYDKSSHSYSFNFYYNKNDTHNDGAWAIFMPALIIATIPLIITFIYQFFYFCLSIAIFGCVIFIAKQVRRISKMVKKHINNKNIHKEEG